MDRLRVLEAEAPVAATLAEVADLRARAEEIVQGQAGAQVQGVGAVPRVLNRFRAVDQAAQDAGQTRRPGFVAAVQRAAAQERWPWKPA